MYPASDPRFRRTLNDISQTIEAANQSAQTSVLVFGHEYINPCLASVQSCFRPCVDCLGNRRRKNDRIRRHREDGTEDLDFDFYDDWSEEDERTGLLGWSSDQDDDGEGIGRNARGYGATAGPDRQRRMGYSTREQRMVYGKSRTVEKHNNLDEGRGGMTFLRLWGKRLGLGRRDVPYRPDVAGLQNNPGRSHRQGSESEEGRSITDESEASYQGQRSRKSGRPRRNTAGSGRTNDSLSSRGDLFASDDEEDAVPLDDGFAVVLERRTTNSTMQDERPSRGKRPGGSRVSTRTVSSRTTPQSNMSRVVSDVSLPQQMTDPEAGDMNVAKQVELGHDVVERRVSLGDKNMAQSFDGQQADVRSSLLLHGSTTTSSVESIQILEQ